MSGHQYVASCLPPMVRSRFPHLATCSCSWVAERRSSSGALAMAAWEAHRDAENGHQDATRSPRFAQDRLSYIARLHEAAGHYAAATAAWTPPRMEDEERMSAWRAARHNLIETARTFLDDYGGRPGTSLKEVVEALGDDPVGFAAWRYAWNWTRVDQNDVIDAGVMMSTRERLLEAARTSIAP